MREVLLIASGWAMHYLAHSATLLAALGAAAWLGDRLLRRIGPGAQHCMWVAALLPGVALPLFPAGWLANLGHAGTAAGAGTVAVTYRMIADAAEQCAPRWAPPRAFGVAIAAGYLLTVLVCLARLLWRYGRTRAMAERATVLTLGARMERLLEDVARQAGAVVPAVRCSAEVRGPVVLGWRPLLVVPAEFFTAQDEDIAAALAHECAHIARRDFAKNLIYEFVAIAVAYHPAAWLMRRRIAETRELVCDEMAAAANESRPEYAASLLRLAQAMADPGVVTHAIGVFDGDILEERIMRLTIDVPKVSRMQRIAIVAIASCALLSGAVTAMALPFDVEAQNEAQDKVYKIGGDVTAPVLVHAVDAEFSKKAKDAKYQGVSVVSLVVDAHGMPQHVHTVRKLGMGLDEKAIEAVRQYKFEPAMRKGKPVAVAITIEVNFKLY